MLKDTKMDPELSLRFLASQTTGFSGSDLRELCRNAAMVPVRECMRAMEHDEEALTKVEKEVARFSHRFVNVANWDR
jgi:SpoVK/Ycf46/Vps4 family AAA+-type ATPase